MWVSSNGLSWKSVFFISYESEELFERLEVIYTSSFDLPNPVYLLDTVGNRTKDFYE